MQHEYLQTHTAKETEFELLDLIGGIVQRFIVLLMIGKPPKTCERFQSKSKHVGCRLKYLLQVVQCGMLETNFPIELTSVGFGKRIHNEYQQQ